MGEVEVHALRGVSLDLEIVADLLSSEAVKVEAGQPVIIEQWGGDRPLTGRVRVVEPSGFTKVSALEEQRAYVIVDIDDRPKDLGDGYRVEIRVIVWSKDNLRFHATLAPAPSGRFRQGRCPGLPAILPSRPAFAMCSFSRPATFVVITGLNALAHRLRHASQP